MTLLNVQQLCKTFDGLVALDQVSFTLKQGDVLGIVGSNGAGKSTLFHLITGYLNPTSGNILFEQQPVEELSPEQRVRDGIARTFQKNRLFFGLTVEDNIRTGCFLSQRGGLKRTLFGISRAEKQAIQNEVDTIVALTGLDAFRHNGAATLSYGYQRRLEVAVALGAKPKLLLLDEPFSGQSPKSIEEMGQVLHGLAKTGISMMLIEHRMESIIAYCNRLLVMDQGRVLIPAPTTGGVVPC